VAAAYGDKSLKKTQINAIIKNVKEGKSTTDQWKLNGRRKVWNLAFIMMPPPTSKDPGVTVRKLALAHGVSKNTIHNTFHKDLNLSKKSARWVPKLLTDERKMERGRMSEAVFGVDPLPFKGNVGVHCDDGRVGGVVSHPRNETAVKTVAEEG
jgi:hypothetical protein